MAMTKTALDNALREKNVVALMALLKESGEEVLRVGGNVIAFPTTDEESNESWIEITIKVPKGERIAKEDGGGFGGYDGYGLAEFYENETQRKAEEAEKKKAAAAAKKAKSTAKKKEPAKTEEQGE